MVANIIMLRAISKQSNGELYDNGKDDMGNQIIYVGNNNRLAKKKFAEIVQREKKTSWVKDCCPNGRVLYSHIDLYEEDNEFYCENQSTGEILHIQLVKKEIVNE